METSQVSEPEEESEGHRDVTLLTDEQMKDMMPIENRITIENRMIGNRTTSIAFDYRWKSAAIASVEQV